MEEKLNQQKKNSFFLSSYSCISTEITTTDRKQPITNEAKDSYICISNDSRL